MNHQRGRKHGGMRLRGPMRMVILSVAIIGVIFIGAKVFSLSRTRSRSSSLNFQERQAPILNLQGQSAKLYNPANEVYEEHQLQKPSGSIEELKGMANKYVREQQQQDDDEQKTVELSEDERAALQAARRDLQDGSNHHTEQDAPNMDVLEVENGADNALFERESKIVIEKQREMEQQAAEYDRQHKRKQQHSQEEEMNVDDDIGDAEMQPERELAGWEEAVHRVIYESETWYPSQETVYVPNQRLVHLDLKGAPPTIEYLKSVLPMYKKLGATGLLIEYEDMFPYSKALKMISANNAYSITDINELLEFAVHLDFMIIPLVQTFGHMEFVLKYKELQHLRETPELPTVICPCQQLSLELVTEMLDQVMAVHQKFGGSYIHIGSDEVWNLGTSQACLEKMKEGLTVDDLFLEHVSKVAGYVRKKKFTPLMWDDMYRHVDHETLMKYNIGGLVEPMIWQYHPNVFDYLPDSVWQNYAKVFRKVWAASSFKGATGPSMFATNITYHAMNHLSWLRLMTHAKNQFHLDFVGIVLTGWQRYDHFAVLCELLPAGTPSLGINLQIMSTGNFSTKTIMDTSEILQFPEEMNIELSQQGMPSAPPKFSGGEVFYETLTLYNLSLWIESFASKSQFKGWMTDYNIKYNFTNPMHFTRALTQFHPLLDMLANARASISKSLGQVYDKYTVSEWIEQVLDPLTKKMVDLHETANRLMKRTTWPRRPLEASSSIRDVRARVSNEQSQRRPPLARSQMKRVVAPRLRKKPDVSPEHYGRSNAGSVKDQYSQLESNADQDLSARSKGLESNEDIEHKNVAIEQAEVEHISSQDIRNNGAGNRAVGNQLNAYSEHRSGNFPGNIESVDPDKRDNIIQIKNADENVAHERGVEGPYVRNYDKVGDNRFRPVQSELGLVSDVREAPLNARMKNQNKASNAYIQFDRAKDIQNL